MFGDRYAAVLQCGKVYAILVSKKPENVQKNNIWRCPNQSVQFSQVDPDPAAQMKMDLFGSGSETGM